MLKATTPASLYSIAPLHIGHAATRRCAALIVHTCCTHPSQNVCRQRSCTTAASSSISHRHTAQVLLPCGRALSATWPHVLVIRTAGNGCSLLMPCRISPASAANAAACCTAAAAAASCAATSPPAAAAARRASTACRASTSCSTSSYVLYSNSKLLLPIIIGSPGVQGLGAIHGSRTTSPVSKSSKTRSSAIAMS